MDTNAAIIRDALIEAHKAGQDGKDCTFPQWAERLADRIASLRQVPEGYVLVPREPTDEMLRVWLTHQEAAGGRSGGDTYPWMRALRRYSKMLAAAPQANPAPPTSGFHDCTVRANEDIGVRITSEPATSVWMDKRDAEATPAQAATMCYSHQVPEEAVAFTDSDLSAFIEATTPAQAGAGLPELPPHQEFVWVLGPETNRKERPSKRYFSADQMREYARQARRGG